jgi:hypothetical protein
MQVASEERFSGYRALPDELLGKSLAAGGLRVMIVAMDFLAPEGMARNKFRAWATWLPPESGGDFHGEVLKLRSALTFENDFGARLKGLCPTQKMEPR